ncbi:secreted glucosidase [Dactylonectria estremocensis]|uniref:Secreted glucosidase n=1 Tax=Dactylonectria estremocensis TaxID=1079267 RepID=A0A9P9EM13_9HYPO|nr:secreted glucosidase [Dactylonectria estremocensis]
MGLKNIIVGALLCGVKVQAAIPKIRGFRLTWADDFNGYPGTLPDGGNWIIDTGTSYPGGPPAWGTWEIQTYTNSTENVRVNGKGDLLITALRNSSGSWTSSRIETQRTDFMAQPGGKMRIQADLKIPDLGNNGVGYWAAFWTLGSEFRGDYWNWPSVGEYDIMESINTLDRVWGVLHCDTNPGGACDEPNGIGNSRPCPKSSCAGDFHTYAVEVDRTGYPETLSWFVDGEQFHQVNETQLPTDVWEKTVHRPHFILLNLAMGGGFPNGVYGGPTPTNSTVSGGTYEVAYVAVYNSIGHRHYHGNAALNLHLDP